jgi:DNA-binding transcriptional MerR regulator
MKRNFGYITVRMIIDALHEEGIPITRLTFYRKEKKGLIPVFNRTSGGWRNYTEEQADTIKNIVRKDYGRV